MADISALSMIWGIFEWYHFLMMAAIIALIIFWVMYRRKQM